MCRWLLLLVCAHFFLAGGQVASLHTLVAAPTQASIAQSSDFGGASQIDHGLEDHAALDNAEPLLVELPPEVPELLNNLLHVQLVEAAASSYKALDVAGPPRSFLEGLHRPPRFSGVLL